MSFNFKIFQIQRNDVISGSHIQFNTYPGGILIQPQFRANYYAKITRASDLGDAVMSGAVKVDGDLVLTAGWGDGFAIRRIQDDGTIAVLYTDQYPRTSAEGGNYAYFLNIALDRGRGKAYVGTYAYSGIRVYDYYAFKNGGSGPAVKENWYIPSQSNAGFPYFNSFSMAGDYLYYGASYNSYVSVQKRVYTPTMTEESLTVINKGNNSRGGWTIYSPDTDRVYHGSWYYSELWVTTNASNALNHPTDPPKCFCIKTSQILNLETWMRNFTVVEDKNNRNNIFVGSGLRWGWIDITNCIDGDPPTTSVPSFAQGKPNTSTARLDSYPYAMAGYFHGYTPNDSYGSDFIAIRADRTYGEMGGWFDQENNELVLVNNYDTADFYSDAPLQCDYGGDMNRVTTTNGTNYWVYTGYGHHGHAVTVFADSDGPGFETTAEIILGTYQLDGNENIGSIRTGGLLDAMRVLTGTSLSLYVSNDNGATWEPYTADTTHVFASTGNQAQIKISITNNGYRTAYIHSYNGIGVTITQDDTVPRNSKVAATRLHNRVIISGGAQ